MISSFGYSMERTKFLFVSGTIAAASNKVVGFGEIQRHVLQCHHQRVEPETLESGRKAVMAL